MRPFDPSTYLKDVLGPYVGTPDVPGLFHRYCLDVDDADDRAIEARLREVKALWDKRSEHPRYGGLIRLLAGRHGEALLTLADPEERAREAQRAREEATRREQEVAAAQRHWEELLDEVVKSQGGLDPAKRAMLEKAAARAGVDAEFARPRLDAAPVAAMPDVLDPERRADVRNALAALAQDTAEPRMGLSLFHALGMSAISLDGAEIAARHREIADANAKRAHGHTKSVYGTVLAQAKMLLLDDDPRAYVAGLQLDVADTLAAEGIRAAANDGVIDEVEAEHLVRQALELGLTRDLAEHVIAQLARENGVGLRTGTAVDYVACPSCNTPHPRPSAPDQCRRCGTPVFIPCPADGCDTRNDATNGRCTACGADLHRHVAALKQLAAIPELIAAGRLRHAEGELTEAAGALGDLPEVSRGRAEVDAALSAARASWAEVSSALEARRLYAARQLLRGLVRSAGDVPGLDGSPAAVELEWVQARVGDVEAALDSGRRAEGPAREAAFSRALDLASDCREADAELARIPPRPVARVDVVVDDAGVIVRWPVSPTPGARYEVRRTGAGGAGGEVVAVEEALQVDDGAADAGAIVRYAVTVLRGSRRSEAAVSAPTLIAREVAELTVRDGDGTVRLNWRPVGASGRVRVERRGEGEEIAHTLTPDATGLTDGGVVNGWRYAYRVFVEYAGLDGRSHHTRGKTVYGQPAARPEMVQDLELRRDGERATITFPPPPSGSVVVIRSDAEPSIEPGAELDPARLASLGSVLPTDASGARDTDPGSGARWYLPVTVAGGMAVAGRALRHLALPEISDVQAVEAAGAVRVTWFWPEGVRIALVVWRRDRQPAGPEDSQAERRPWRLGEYRDQGGFTIEAPGDQPVFVAVYAAARIDGELVASGTAGRGARAGVARRQRCDVRYRVRRSGLRRKRLDVEIVDPADARLPGLVLIARGGDLLPRNAADGDVLARLGGDGPRSTSVEIGGRERPLTVRMFLSAASEESAYRLHDPLVDELVIR